MKNEKSQEQIKYENTLFNLVTGDYRGYDLGSVGNIAHWLRALGLQQYDIVTIGFKNDVGKVNLYGKLLATFIINEKLNMPIFTFDKEYDWLQDAQDNYISCLGKYPDPFEKYKK